MGQQGTMFCPIELILLCTADIQAAGSIQYHLLDLLYENKSKATQNRPYQ